MSLCHRAQMAPAFRANASRVKRKWVDPGCCVLMSAAQTPELRWKANTCCLCGGGGGGMRALPALTHRRSSEGLSRNQGLNLQPGTERSPCGEKKKRKKKKDFSSCTFYRRNSMNKTSRELRPPQTRINFSLPPITRTESCCVLETSGGHVCCCNNAN